MANDVPSFVPQPAPGAELRAYQPSWRDRIAGYLFDPTGEGSRDHPDVARSNFVQGLLGSTGLGHTSGSLIDLLPPGAIMSAKEASDAGHPVEAATNVAAAAFPAVRGVGRVGAKLMSEYPRAAAALAGATGAAAIPAEAGSNLTPRQQRDLEFKNTQAKNQAELAREQAAAEQQRKIEADRAAAELALKTEDERRTIERRQAEADAVAQRQKMEAEGRLPFREKYPNLSAALPAIGMGISAALPYGARLRNLMSNNRAVGMMEDAVGRGESALANGASAADRAGVRAEMKSGLETPMRSTSGGWGPTVAGALVGGDVAALLPQEYDAANLPPGDKNREAALHTLTDPHELATRLLPSVMGAGAFAKSAGYAPLTWPERLPPTARMQGLLAQAKTAPPKASAVAAAPKRSVPRIVSSP